MRCVGIFLLLGGCVLSPHMVFPDNHPAGGRSAGLAHASVVLRDMWCFHHNQAGLANVENHGLGLYHRAGYLKEMDHQSLFFLFPVASGGMAASCSCYGYEHYQQIKVGFAYGRWLGKNFSAVIQLDYFRTRISGCPGRVDALSFEAGVQFRVNAQWLVAAHFFNPLTWEVTGNDHFLPSIFRVGAGWQPAGPWLMLVEVEKELERPAVPKLALEHELAPGLFLRTGISWNPVLQCFGLGYCWKGFQLDLAFCVHPYLGSEPNFSLSYVF